MLRDTIIWSPFCTYITLLRSNLFVCPIRDKLFSYESLQIFLWIRFRWGWAGQSRAVSPGWNPSYAHRIGPLLYWGSSFSIKVIFYSPRLLISDLAIYGSAMGIEGRSHRNMFFLGVGEQRQTRCKVCPCGGLQIAAFLILFCLETLYVPLLQLLWILLSLVEQVLAISKRVIQRW